MSTATQTVNFSNVSASTPQAQLTFALLGGTYGLTVTATFGGGNVQLQQLSLDGSTWVNVGGAISTNSSASDFTIPAGQYRFVITTATAVFISLSRIFGP